MNQSMIRLVRPTETLYRCIGKIIDQYDTKIYDMTENKFVGLVMKEAKGMLNPVTIQTIYQNLMKEAGI